MREYEIFTTSKSKYIAKNLECFEKEFRDGLEPDYKDIFKRDDMQLWQIMWTGLAIFQTGAVFVNRCFTDMFKIIGPQKPNEIITRPDQTCCLLKNFELKFDINKEVYNDVLDTIFSTNLYTFPDIYKIILEYLSEVKIIFKTVSRYRESPEIDQEITELNRMKIISCYSYNEVRIILKFDDIIKDPKLYCNIFSLGSCVRKQMYNDCENGINIVYPGETKDNDIIINNGFIVRRNQVL